MKAHWLLAFAPWISALDAQPVVGLFETLRQLSLEQHPEWTDFELDSAYAAWMQWTVVGAPREAGALSFIAPQQQFQLEIYQSQFGWPRDSTEWRAIPLTTMQREAIQALYHGGRTAPAGRTLRGPVDPLLSLGWSCSGCTLSRAYRGTRLGLTSSAAGAMAQPWSSPAWSLRSPSDVPVRVWAGPRSVAVGLRPAMWARSGGRSLQIPWFSDGVATMRRLVDHVAVGWDTSGTWYGDASLRASYFGFKAGVSSRGWAELSAAWYGPGGLLVSVQREWVPAEFSLWGGAGAVTSLWGSAGAVTSSWGGAGAGGTPRVGARPGAGATPWRPLRGNRATAALPLWAGRLSLQQTTTGPSATWSDRSRSVVWYPGQLNLGIRSEQRHWNTDVPLGLRSHIYLGRAQGASVQIRWPSGPLTTELGIAGITLSESQPNILERLLDGNPTSQFTKERDPAVPDLRHPHPLVLPRATGPMTLWRPGWTAEVALTYSQDLTRMSARIRRSPSGWSGSVRAQLPIQNW